MAGPLVGRDAGPLQTAPQPRLFNASETPAATAPLATGAIVPSTITVTAPAEPEWKSEKVVCQKQEVIGSLIQSKRVCATKRNWARQQQAAQDNLKVLIEPGAFSPGR